LQYSHKAANHERAALQGRRTQAKRRNESERSLVKAAIDIISEEGVATATFDMIARRSGYSRGLVGQRFGSKQGLIDAVIAYLQAKQDAAASDRRIDELPGLKALLTYVDFYLKELADEREGLAYFRLLSSAVADNLALAATFAATHAVARSRLEAWVRRGQREGNVRADLDPFSTAMMTGSLLLGVSIQLLVDPAWAGSFDPATKNEDALLSLLESRTESSRLSCQLKMNAARDGVVVRTLALEADA